MVDSEENREDSSLRIANGFRFISPPPYQAVHGKVEIPNRLPRFVPDYTRSTPPPYKRENPINRKITTLKSGLSGESSSSSKFLSLLGSCIFLNVNQS